MLAYTLNKTLSLVPEAHPLVKEASVEETFPIDSEASCLASALAMAYLEKVAHTPVDLSVRERVGFAVQAYELQDKVQELSGKMVKAAQAQILKDDSSTKEHFLAKQAYFTGNLSGLINMEETVAQATSLYKEASEKGWEVDPEVVLYSGNGFLNKESSVKALVNRFNKTNNPTFVKLARAVKDINEAHAKPETLVDLGLTVYNLDKEAGIKGNFFTESFHSKEAELGSVMRINLGKASVPFEKIQSNKHRIADFVGKDITAEIDKGPLHFKQIAATLPRDIQGAILDVLKNT